jgi:uncharacterized protein
MTATAKREAPDSVRLAIVDTDVHHGCSDRSDLYPYLPKVHRDRLAEYGFGTAGFMVAQNGGIRGTRADAQDAVGAGVPGGAVARLDRLQSQLLEACGVDVAVLTGGPVNLTSANTDIDYASALCRAFNDYTIEHWLEQDLRLRLAMNICTQDPHAAAAEIDRVGDHAGVVAVLMPCGAPRPYGQRFYHPIYEACERHGLAIALHFSGEGNGINPPPTSAGYPTYYLEFRAARSSYYQVHLASFICEGVFELFPQLKVAMLECGFGWVPSYLWHLDADWKGLRYQTPWVKRLPSEYAREHIRYSSQPADEPAPPEGLEKTLEWMDAAHTLMFSSDYPHWDFDDPAETFKSISPELRRRIFSENARETFKL